MHDSKCCFRNIVKIINSTSKKVYNWAFICTVTLLRASPTDWKVSTLVFVRTATCSTRKKCSVMRVAWENGRRLARSPFELSQNDVRLVITRENFVSTNQKHYLDLGSDASSVWNFCAGYSDVVLRGYKWLPPENITYFAELMLVIASPAVPLYPPTKSQCLSPSSAT